LFLFFLTHTFIDGKVYQLGLLRLLTLVCSVFSFTTLIDFMSLLESTLVIPGLLLGGSDGFFDLVNLLVALLEVFD